MNNFLIGIKERKANPFSNVPILVSKFKSVKISPNFNQ